MNHGEKKKKLDLQGLPDTWDWSVTSDIPFLMCQVRYLGDQVEEEGISMEGDQKKADVWEGWTDEQALPFLFHKKSGAA